MGEVSNGELTAADVITSKVKPGNLESSKHQRSSSLPLNFRTTTASDSDEEGIHSNEKITLTAVTPFAGLDTATECSSDEEDAEGESSQASSRTNTDVVAAANSLGGKTSVTRGRGSKPSSMTIHNGGSFANSKSNGHQQQRIPPKKKKKPKPKGMRKVARFGVEDSDYEDEEEGRKTKKHHNSTSWSRKSLHRPRIAKEYTTSESEDEEPTAKQSSNSSQRPLEPLKSNCNSNDNSINKSMAKVVIASEKSVGSDGVEKDEGNASTDSEKSTTTTYDSDDELEYEDEHDSKRRRTHSGIRKPSLQKSSHQEETSRVTLADEENSIPASSMREYYRSDVESHDADPEHELWDEQGEDTDDDRHIRKIKSRNEQGGNSASFSEAVPRKFVWTKIFHSFPPKGNDSDDEGSNAISVKNLAPMVNEQMLQELFGGCGTVTCMNISRDEFGRCSGSAYVEFDSGAVARKAVQKTGTKLLEKLVFCAVAHQMATSKHVESKAPAAMKPADPPRPTSSGSPRGGGIDISSLFKPFQRGDTSEVSVGSRHKKSKSSDSFQLPRGVISPGDTITASSGNEQSVHSESTRGGKASGGGGSKKKLFGLSKSRSSGSSRNSEQVGKSNSSDDFHSQSQFQMRDPDSEQQSRSTEIVFQPRGIELPLRSAPIELHTPPIPEYPFPESLNEGIISSKGHHTKKRKWNFAKWRRKHRWVKISLWKWMKKPRWHWWHFANLSARWGKASRRPAVESTLPPPPTPPPPAGGDFEAEEQPPEGYPTRSN